MLESKPDLVHGGNGSVECGPEVACIAPECLGAEAAASWHDHGRARQQRGQEACARSRILL